MLKFRWWVLALIALIIFSIVACALLPPKHTDRQGISPFDPSIRSVHLKLGNPSNATEDVAISPNNYLLVKPQYVISYNNAKHIPNWSSWQLNQSWIGNLSRNNDFHPDPSLPKGWYQVRPSDYNSSGYDRGHLTPSADRDNTLENMSATYAMTNIIPQAPDNNRGPWAALEQYCRTLVGQGKELYIVAGGYGEKPAIGKGKVKIVPPARTWKVLVILDQPGVSLTKTTRLIAVDMPNEQGIKDVDWREFQVSVAQLEARTGYNFLTAIPNDIRQVIERRVNAVTE